MTTQVLTLGNTILTGSGKRGILKPMEEGGDYYLLNAGGFNIKNRSGISYPFNHYLQGCMEKDSDFNRRVSEQQLYCERGHPTPVFHTWENGKLVQHMITDIMQWIMRLKTVEENNKMAFIRKVHFIMEGGVNDPVHLKVEIKGFGQHKEEFVDSIKDPDQNTAISIRTVVSPFSSGSSTKNVEYWTNFDVVVEQGMLNACKYRTDGLESLTPVFDNNGMATDMSVSFDELMYKIKKLANDESRFGAMAGTESHNELLGMIKQLERGNTHAKSLLVKPTNALDIFS